MPCQCGSATVGRESETPPSGCECATDSTGGCQCGSGSPTPPERESLERLVMELDKRVRKLEASR